MLIQTIILFLLTFTSILFPQKNLILYYLPNNTPFDIKCNPLHDNDIDCEYNKQKFDNYKEFSIVNDTLKIKNEYKNMMIYNLEKNDHYDVFSVKSLDQNVLSKLMKIFSNECSYKIDKDKHIHKRSQLTSIINDIAIFKEYDNVILFQGDFINKEIIIHYLDNSKYNKFIYIENSKIKIEYLLKRGIYLGNILYEKFSHKFEYKYKYSKSIQDDLKKYKILGDDFGKISSIFLSNRNMVNGEIINENKIFTKNKYAELFLNEKFKNGNVNLLLKSVDGRTYSYAYKEVEYLLYYYDVINDKKFYEFEKNNIKIGNVVYSYKEGFLYDFKSSSVYKGEYPHEHILEKRTYDNGYIIVENLEFDDLNSPFDYVKRKYDTLNQEYYMGDYDYSFDDRILQFHILENNNLIIEVQNDKQYSIIEIDNNFKAKWINRYDRSDISLSCGSTPHLGYTYVYLGTKYESNEYFHELVQMAGVPRFNSAKIVEKYPELYFSNLVSSYLPNKILSVPNFSPLSLEPYKGKNIIYKIDSFGNTQGYYDAIIDMHIVKDEQSLLEISNKYNYSAYNCRRINAVFNKSFNQYLSNSMNTYAVFNSYNMNLNNIIFNIEYIQEHKKNHQKYGLDKWIDIALSKEIGCSDRKYCYDTNQAYESGDYFKLLSLNHFNSNHNVKELETYQKKNFIQYNYIYNGQVLFFYNKSRHFIPRNGHMKIKKYNSQEIQYEVELKNYVPTFNNPIFIKNYNGNNLLELYSDSIFILNNFNGDNLVKKKFKVIDNNAINMYNEYDKNYHNPFTKHLTYSKIKIIDDGYIYMNDGTYRKNIKNSKTMIENEIPEEFLRINSNVNYIVYYEEFNRDLFNKRKIFYYENLNEAIVCEYIKDKLVKMSGKYEDGAFWFEKFYTNVSYSKSSSNYYTKSLKVNESNVLYPHIVYLSKYNDGSLSHLLEFENEYAYKLYEYGKLIEHKTNDKYEKYYESGGIALSVNFHEVSSEYLLSGQEYYENGKLKKKYRLIEHSRYNLPRRKYHGQLETSLNYDENGKLLSDRYYSDINKMIVYYKKYDQIESMSQFMGHRFLNKDCVSKKTYYIDGDIKGELYKKYDNENAICYLEHMAVYYDNGEINQIIYPEKNEYIVFNTRGEILFDGSPNRKRYDNNAIVNYKLNIINNPYNVRKYDKEQEYLIYDYKLKGYKRDYDSVPDKIIKQYTYDDVNKNWLLIDNVKNEQEYDIEYFKEVNYCTACKYDDFRHVLEGKDTFTIEDNELIKYETKYYNVDKKTENSRIENYYIKSINRYEKGKLNGEQTYFYKSTAGYDRSFDIVSKKLNYLNNNYHGVQYEYYMNGKLKSEKIYNNGIKTGVWKYYYDNGNIKGIEEYRVDGVLYLIKKYNLDGYEVCNTILSANINN